MVPWESAFSLKKQITADGLHVWRHDPSCPVDVRFLKYDVRHNIGLNRHDYLELFYVASGRFRFHIQGRSTLVSPGDLCVVGRSYFHTMAVHSEAGIRRRTRGVGLYFMGDFVASGDHAGDDAELLAPFLVSPSERNCVVRAETGVPRDVFALMQEIKAELPARSRRSRLAVRTYLRMALLKVLKHQSNAANSVGLRERQTDLESLAPVFDFLTERYREAITLGQAAKVAGMSESKFVRTFRRATGSSFVTYVNRFRVARAQELLAATDKSIADIGLEVGFSGQSYFGLMFRRAVGLAPLQYRRAVSAGTLGPGPAPGSPT
ncbi:MAG TPA: AraC family transcriptional regulator [Polyangiaceae bacterium]|nr:AraC family transcriptional regulator [Polyangiaceae bacterium]